jgi:two-component system sensor histidine kinase QseC
VLALLPADSAALAGASKPPASGGTGGADTDDLSIALWSADGRVQLSDREGAALPERPGATGFADLDIAGTRWRVYYLASEDRRWRVAVGQAAAERRELLTDLLIGQLLPWLLMLPVLLAAMVLAVRNALKPVRALAQQIGERRADDLRPVVAPRAPNELAPLLTAMNALFARIGQALEHERRMTADAAHELRTPLAALRAQLDAAAAAQAAGQVEAWQHAQQQARVGIDRLAHLVNQLLALSRAEAATAAGSAAVDWRRVVEHALSDCLPVMEQQGAEVEVDWPAHGVAPLPLAGNGADTEALLATLLRNLVDNALRYGPRGGSVRLRFLADAIEIDDDGPGMPAEVLQRLGDRFHRPPGQAQTGSGLGVSIVQRIAAVHGLRVEFINRDGGGLRVRLARGRPATLGS